MLIWCKEGLYVVEVRLEVPKHIESWGEVCFDAHEMMDMMILGMCMQPCMHMRMHVGCVPQPRRLIESVGVEDTWRDGSGGDEGEWGSKGIGSTISGFFQQQTKPRYENHISTKG